MVLVITLLFRGSYLLQTLRTLLLSFLCCHDVYGVLFPVGSLTSSDHYSSYGRGVEEHR